MITGRRILCMLCVMSLCGAMAVANQLDQSQAQNDNQYSFGRIGGTWGSVGQTFTTGAGVDTLTKVQLMVMDAAGTGYDGVGAGVTVNVYDNSDRTQLLGQAAAPDSAIPGLGAPAWVDFSFASPIAVAPASSYYIEATHSDGRGSYNIAVGSNNYGAGTLRKADVSIPNINGVTTCDSVFKTYDGSLSLDIDQSATPTHLHWLRDQAILGQTFKPSASSLGQIDLRMVDDSDAGVDSVTMHLFGDVDRTDYLGSATVAGLANGWADASFVFASPIAVTPGQEYYFDIASEDTANSYGYGWNAGSTYGDGNYWKSDALMNTTGMEGCDLAFQTYAVPEPTTMLLLVGGSLALLRRKLKTS